LATARGQKTKTDKRKSVSLDEFWFDQEKVDHVVNWIHDYCTHPVGDLQGQPLVMPEWFIRDVITPVFGWKKKNGKRKFKECYMEVASGNAKSTLMTALALYCLCADKQTSPMVYCVAGSRKQAGIIFNNAKLMVQQSEELSELITINQYTLSVRTPEYGYGILTAIASETKLQEGLNPTAVFLDETHVQPGPDLYNNLKKNAAKRGESLFFSGTTAGITYTFAHELAIKARDIKSGRIKSTSFHPVVYAADLEADDFDWDQIKMANPGIDYLDMDSLLEAMEDAKKSPSALASWRRYRLNKWAGASNTFIPDKLWMSGTACEDKSEEGLRDFRQKYLSIEALKGRDCFVGLDLSANRDTTSSIWIFPPREKGERLKIFKRVYIPKDTLEDRIRDETGQYAEWYEHGDITITPKVKQDQEAIWEDIKFLKDQFKVMGFAYDSWNADWIVSQLEAHGVETKAYKQDYPMMSMPMKKLDTMISQAQIEHGGDPVLRWHCSNTEAKTRIIGGSEYMMPTKSKEKARIDGMVALIIAIGMWIWKMKEVEEEEKSHIKKHGVLKIQLNR
jgi:phage terminase large subunit-like protein